MKQSEADAQLRSLSSWLLGLDELLPIKGRITEIRAELKTLQAQAAEVRARLSSTCPLQLGELEMRFWTKAHIVDDDDSCWEWTRGRHPEGYGTFRWVNPDTGESEVTNAQVVSLYLTLGHMPRDQGNHHCDNPPCIRPRHLYDGTHAENMRDRQVRGRYVVQARLLNQNGSENLVAKLTDELVIRARNLARDGLMLAEVDRQISSPVSRTVLRWAITGRTWKHLDAICPPAVKAQGGSSIKGKTVPHRPKDTRRFSDDQIRAIRAARSPEPPAGKVPLADLATQYEVTMGMISSIEHRRSYAHVT